MIRLVQLRNGPVRRVAVVEEPLLHFLEGFDSVYALAKAAIETGVGLAGLISRNASDQTLEYDAVWAGKSHWRLLVPLDHPEEPARCLVSGTGLTHFGSARDRQAMHANAAAEGASDAGRIAVAKAAGGASVAGGAGAAAVENVTDSMKMFRWGVEGGRPKAGHIGIPPEWFYKGTGSILRPHGDALDVPGYADDGGEEAEIAGLYVIGPDGVPRRVGMATGNEFSDHLFEKKNYLNLAASKVRTCALGPELVIDPKFESVTGEARIERHGGIVWSKTIRTGEAEMCHSLANIEHHHFKFETHRQPGDVHVHYFGAHSLSFGDGVRLADGDVMAIRWEGFGRELCNPVRIAAKEIRPVGAIALK